MKAEMDKLREERNRKQKVMVELREKSKKKSYKNLKS